MTPLEFTELHQPPEKLLQLPPARIDGTSTLTSPPSKSAGKTAPTTPLELTELQRLPPFQIGRKNCSNYPPRIDGTSTLIPLPNWPEKLLQLPPARMDGTSTLTPLPNRPEKTAPTTPPRIDTELHPLPPLQKIDMCPNAPPLNTKYTTVANP